MTKSRVLRLGQFIFAIGVCVCGCANRTVDQATLDQQLLEAAEKSDVAAVRQLLRKGAKVGAKNESHWTALDEAAARGDRTIVALLVETKIDASGKNEALFWAAGNEPLVITTQSQQKTSDQALNSFDNYYTDVARLLLDKGAQVGATDVDGATPLIRAASHGETGVVKLLLDRGAEVEARDQSGATALLAAACECAVIDMPDTLGAIKLLLEKGANIEARDHQGNTPLILAAGWGRTENVEFLLEKHANIEARDNDGNTALSVSATGGGYPTSETVKYLVDHGSKLEAKNNEGRTPLSSASAGDGTDQVEIVKMWLLRGADVRSRDKHGDTALSLAQRDRNPEIIEGTHANLVKILKRAMAGSH